MDTDKIKVFGARIKVDSTGKLAELERAEKVHVDWVALAERETELFRQDMQALRVLPPDHYIGAVESIPLVIELIEKLRAAGAHEHPSQPTLEQVERRYILEVIEAVNGDKAEAAKVLGIDLSTLYRKLKRFETG